MNLRATAAKTIPNMVRGILIFMTLGFEGMKTDLGVVIAAILVGLICFALAFYSALSIPETHNIDLDYLEE
jgi:hypothetical protein